MNVKEIAQKAVLHVADLFESEGITNIGLEEVTFDESADEWLVTVGFSRPWDYPKPIIAGLGSSLHPNRVYKILRIRSTTGEVLSVKNRQP